MDTIIPEHIFNEPNLLDDGENNQLSPIKTFYKGKTVFLTGGLGFLGQLYAEKLLRCDVKHIYLLGRAKKEKTAVDRLKETFSGSHFIKLYNHDKHYLDRISIVEGDMGKTGIGLSESDRRDLIENVEIVLHAAADVRFDQKLHKLLTTNLCGTRELLELTSQMKKKVAFAFISTAYSHCVKSYVEEKFYEAPVDPEVMMKLAEFCNGKSTDILDVMTERIISPWPNTYTYTKALTEELVRRYATKFSICIVRPSIVISTHEDPIPGWSNSIYGLNGMLVAHGIGFLRLMHAVSTNIGDIICVDFVINSTLAALWITHKDSKKNTVENKDPEIYHVCSSKDRPTSWGTISSYSCSTFDEYPSIGCFWRACPNIVSNKFWFTYLTIWYHVIPAIFTDIVLKIRGNKLRVLPIYRKVQRFTVALNYFMCRDLRFDNSNMKRVLDRMSPADRDFFPSDVRRYNFSEYIYTYVNGLKVYMGLESLDDLDKARKKYKIFNVLHWILLSIYYGLHIAMFTFLADKLGVFQYIQNHVQNTVGFLQNPHEF